MAGSRPSSALTPSGFFLLRTPLLPFGRLVEWSAGIEAPAALDQPARLAEALEHDRRLLRERLTAELRDDVLREAIFVASPDLAEGLESWPMKADGKKGARLERALTRYFLRMAARPTPFGLFAGCSVGELSEATTLELGPRASYRRHSRLDLDYLDGLTRTLVRDPKIRRWLRFRPNSSLCRSGDRLHYARASVEEGGRSYHLVSVQVSDYLQRILAGARKGLELPALAEALVRDEQDVSLDEATEFIQELVDEQVLVAELAPAVTGTPALETLLEDLNGFSQPAGAVVEHLERACRGLRALDRHGLANHVSAYHAIAHDLSPLPVEPKLSRLFHVDLYKPLRAGTLGPVVIDQIRRGVELLHRLSGPTETHALSRFIEEFDRRYGGREIPLTEVLDEENGIGFWKDQGPAAEASPLLNGLRFPPSTDPTNPRWEPRHSRVLERVMEGCRSGADEIVLDEEEIHRTATEPAVPLPDALAVNVTLVADPVRGIDEQDFRVVLHGAYGPSGAQLLARFCHGSARLREHVLRHLKVEESLRSDAIFAEVVHLPEGRMGNVLARPVLRESEICYLGRPGVPTDRVIPLEDLLVSVRHGRVVLRSATLGREIVPRLSSAHNFSGRSLGPYRFLGFLQAQNVATPLSWAWGPLEACRFLPRVVCGRLVLSLARWRVSNSEIRAMVESKGPDRYAAVQKFRDERRLPRWLRVVDGDNQLPVDLDNVLAVDMLAELLKNRPEALLSEVYPGPDQLCVRGPEGAFAHELIVPFVGRSAPAERVESRARSPITPPDSSRRFPPGSEWLYAKLYTGSATVDRVLRRVVRPVARRALTTGAVERWFFVRYGDPDWHLRVRFQGRPERLLGEVYPALKEYAEPFLAGGLIWKLQLDTYERELERYGGLEAVELAERLFHADSDAALDLIRLCNGDEGADLRWRLALLSIDRLVADLGLDLGSRQSVLRKLRDSMAKEHRADKQMRIQLGDRFRGERKSLQALLESPDANGNAIVASAVAALGHRSERIARLTAGTQRPSDDLVFSHVHMSLNRILRSAQRAHELVLYDFLVRLYESRLARERDAERDAVGSRT